MIKKRKRDRNEGEMNNLKRKFQKRVMAVILSTTMIVGVSMSAGAAQEKVYKYTGSAVISSYSVGKFKSCRFYGNNNGTGVSGTMSVSCYGYINGRTYSAASTTKIKKGKDDTIYSNNLTNTVGCNMWRVKLSGSGARGYGWAKAN